MITHRIVECTQYDKKGNVNSTWYEIQILRRVWWLLGMKRWCYLTEKFESGRYISQFDSIPEATEYINDMVINKPKDTIIKKPVTSFIS